MAMVRRVESMVARAQRMRARMLAAREAHRLPLLAKEAQRWTFLAAVPPREVFAVMEQMLGSFPFRFELTGESSARIVEFRRKGLVGQWSKRVAIHTRWVTCEARPTASGTVVTVVASRGRGPVPRALQLVQLLSRGSADPRTIYRRRAMPSGPVSLVASWAGMPYRLYTEPRWEAPRGARVLTATGVEAIPGGEGAFTKVRLADGTEGFIETDQIVAAPEASTREAQVEAARFV
ncbi:MAG: hypothetical protein ABSC16_01370 [Candidatus Dormibacteria bacterium]|nr:hypothetical protein [Chloroflexota bacterium]HBV93677.1 hypothetical protein [Chloroflexota bacterium]